MKVTTLGLEGCRVSDIHEGNGKELYLTGAMD